MFSLKNVTKQSCFLSKSSMLLAKYMLPIIAYGKVYDIENQINTSRSVNLWFKKKAIIKLTNVLIFMSLLHGMEQNWINV